MRPLMSEACTCHRRGRTDEEAVVFELEVAQRALREGDLQHAKHHVSGALGLAPADARVHAVFEALASRMGLRAAPEGGWYGDFALAAFALNRGGDLDKARPRRSGGVDLRPCRLGQRRRSDCAWRVDALLGVDRTQGPSPAKQTRAEHARQTPAPTTQMQRAGLELRAGGQHGD
jgi:hypothetical protein